MMSKILTALNLKLKTIQFSRQKANKIELPAGIEIELTNTCNLRCTMCHVSYVKNDKEYFDTSLLPRLNSLNGKWISVGAGFEPAIHLEFSKIIRYFSERNFKIDLTTNGTLFKRKMIEELRDYNIENVTISFDSIKKEIYERIRNGAQFDLALERILSFRKELTHKDTLFAINVTLMQSNIDGLIEFINFWNQYNFHQIRLIFMVLRDLNDNLIHESLYRNKEYAFQKIDDAAEHVIKNNLKISLSSPYFRQSKLKVRYPDNFNGNIVTSNNNERKLLLSPKSYFQYGKYPGMAVSCRSPFVFARILFNGDVQLCYKYSIGNLNEMDFKDIWYGESAQQIRKEIITNPEGCYTCDLYKFCICSDKIDLDNKKNYFQQDII